ncbi:class I SAM-dependent methyltransferase [Nitratireductor thuwali]
MAAADGQGEAMMMTNTDAAFWDRTARRYAKRPVKDQAAYETTLERTRSYLSSEDRVLELGCGTGTTALLLSNAARRITATDISEAMLAIGREKAARQNVGNVDFERATPFDAPFAEASFDAALAFNLLHLIGDVPTAVERIGRLVRPGGHFISKTPCLAGQGFAIRALIGFLQRIGKAPYVNFLSTEGLERTIAAAGFEIIETGDFPRKPPAHFIVARKI